MSDSEYEVEDHDTENQHQENADPEEEEEEPSSSGRGQSSSVPSLRGAPEHEREDIIRRQNAEYQRRTRERQRREYRELVDRHRAQIEQIAALEARVAALVRVLEDAGIRVPDVVEERMGDPDANDGRRLLAELEAYIDEFNSYPQ